MSHNLHVYSYYNAVFLLSNVDNIFTKAEIWVQAVKKLRQKMTLVGGTLVLARTEGRGLLSVRKTRTKISGQFLKCED